MNQNSVSHQMPSSPISSLSSSMSDTDSEACAEYLKVSPISTDQTLSLEHENVILRADNEAMRVLIMSLERKQGILAAEKTCIARDRDEMLAELHLLQEVHQDYRIAAQHTLDVATAFQELQIQTAEGDVAIGEVIDNAMKTMDRIEDALGRVCSLPLQWMEVIPNNTQRSMRRCVYEAENSNVNMEECPSLEHDVSNQSRKICPDTVSQCDNNAFLALMENFEKALHEMEEMKRRETALLKGRREDARTHQDFISLSEQQLHRTQQEVARLTSELNFSLSVISRLEIECSTQAALVERSYIPKSVKASSGDSSRCENERLRNMCDWLAKELRRVQASASAESRKAVEAEAARMEAQRQIAIAQQISWAAEERELRRTHDLLGLVTSYRQMVGHDETFTRSESANVSEDESRFMAPRPSTHLSRRRDN